MLHVCRAVGLFWLAEFLTRKKVRILCYHGFQLVDEVEFRPGLFMSAERFRERLETIMRHGYQVLTLDDAVERMLGSYVESKSVVITIDDGFYSTYKVAAPLLSSFGFASTLYLTTYYVENTAPIPNLVVQYAFWKTGKVQADLSSVLTPGATLTSFHDHDTKIKVEAACLKQLELLPDDESRQVLAAETCEILDVDYVAMRDARLLSLMTPGEVGELGQYGMDVQAHTHRHRFPSHDPAMAREELRENNRVLVSLVQQRPVHFCYPSGVWDASLFAVLREEGMVSATTCDPGLVDNESEMLALERFLDRENISEIEFLAELTGFADLVRSVFR